MDPTTGPWNRDYSIDTPELVALEVPLAGVGSRCLALLIDYALQATVFALGIFALVELAASEPSAHTQQAASNISTQWILAVFLLVSFLLHWGYFTLFEAFWEGRTPGKRLLRIRAMHQSGRSLTLLEALTRNLIRVVDAAPIFYAVGLVCVFVTRRNQRLGDLAAGTLVIHETQVDQALWGGGAARSFTAFLFTEVPSTSSPAAVSRLPADALARLTLADLTAVDNFLDRRLDLPLTVRSQLAAKIAAQLRSKTGIAGTGLTDETFIETVERDARSYR